ncbi:MAG: hypothetical protein A3H32_05040 [Betaproteobacteria bacterium RIFCSPLOWO2_02_FULL_63_19]|nr:MAG: hypothetical protein A3H32_05040 [Betaproteobacteria bacterium RIFCSPLOWO2_02_FULL_63_19]
MRLRPRHLDRGKGLTWNVLTASSSAPAWLDSRWAAAWRSRAEKWLSSMPNMQRPALEKLHARALANGVDDLRWLTGEQAREHKPTDAGEPQCGTRGHACQTARSCMV